MSGSRVSVSSLKVKLHKILQSLRRARLVFPISCNLDISPKATKGDMTCGQIDSKDGLKTPPPSVCLFDGSSSSYVNQACSVDVMELVEWNYEIYQNARNEQLEQERMLESDAL
ncbi:uncharacterized protein [Palaemon carinicauda]|uniref:uncharacterized protein n=1 Tax=Palaemon carinicauda TaxID=392227 RepID=UPI0035B5AADE